MVSSIQVPFSWFDITAAYNNNFITFYFPTDDTTYTSFTITIPDGFYTQSV